MSVNIKNINNNNIFSSIDSFKKHGITGTNLLIGKWGQTVNFVEAAFSLAGLGIGKYLILRIHVLMNRIQVQKRICIAA
jgi:hypothetical protein